MNKARVLVAYASKYGATKEIADEIGIVLQAQGLWVDVLPAEQVKDLSDYQAVVLGSAVYAGSWRGEAVKFLEAHEAALTERAVWLFSSGPTGEGDPVESMKGWRFPAAQQPLADRIQPRDIAFFHGALDMQKLNFAERLIIRGMKVQTGDYRDWKMISSWAESIAQTLEVSY